MYLKDGRECNETVDKLCVHPRDITHNSDILTLRHVIVQWHESGLLIGKGSDEK